MSNKTCKGMNWDWMDGKVHIDKGLYRNYFDCGIYYFDGTFNVVEFPEGMTLYHGSATLADYVVEFPLGIDYYKEYDLSKPDNIPPSNFTSLVATNDDKTIEELLSEYFPISAGWFADPGVARGYSIDSNNSDSKLSQLCKNKCINVYKLKRTIKLILLDDHNIAFILNHSKTPDNVKQYLRSMFTITSSEQITTEHNPFKRISFPNKNRNSKREWDLPFAMWMCSLFGKEYDGYGATIQKSNKHSTSFLMDTNNTVHQAQQFHLELILCNSTKVLKRDLSHISDWQYNGNQPPRFVEKFLRELERYESINVNFHAGNLLEHSIWTLLFTEDSLRKNELSPKLTLDENNKKFISLCGFIHDIGKMKSLSNTTHTNKQRGKFIFHSIPKHPEYGYDMIQNDEIPLHNDKLEKYGKLTYTELMNGFGITPNNVLKDILKLSIRYHWDFGDSLKNLNQTRKTTNDVQRIATDYIKKVLPQYYRTKHQNVQNFIPFYFLTLLTISIADIRGATPYGINRISTSTDINMTINKVSKYFPYLTNMPRKYRGGNIRTISDLDNTGVSYAKYILNMVSN